MTHEPADLRFRGIPLDPEAYDYIGQVRWHQALGRLWNATVTAMRRAAPDLEFFRVFEAQARLALHAHVIVRVPSGLAITASTLGAAARAAAAHHPVTNERVQWGQKGVEDREVLPRHRDESNVMPDDSSSIARTLAYTLKTVVSYSLKDVGHGTSDEDASPERHRFVYALADAARITPCPRCVDDTGHCSSRAHRQHGFSGHVLAMSRPTKTRPGWSFSGLTRGRLREERRAWMSAHHPNPVDRGLGATALVVAVWVQEQRTIRRIERLESIRMARGPNGPS